MTAMTPSAAPLVMLYRRVLRHRGADGAAAALTSMSLLAGYLAAWLAFSVGAALLQELLQPAGLISAMMLWSKSAVLSAAVLALAGLYQFSPLKRACLRQCRNGRDRGPLARGWPGLPRRPPRTSGRGFRGRSSAANDSAQRGWAGYAEYRGARRGCATGGTLARASPAVS